MVDYAVDIITTEFEIFLLNYRFLKTVFRNNNLHFKPSLIHESVVTWAHTLGGFTTKQLAAVMYHNEQTQRDWYNFTAVSKNNAATVAKVRIRRNTIPFFLNRPLLSRMTTSTKRSHGLV